MASSADKMNTVGPPVAGEINSDESPSPHRDPAGRWQGPQRGLYRPAGLEPQRGQGGLGRFIVVAPEWAEDYCCDNDIPFMAWVVLRFNEHIAQALQNQGVDVAHPLFKETVAERDAFGTHWGLVVFFGDDPYKMWDVLKRQQALDFYV